MNYKKGQIVRSLAGHDKGGFFVVLELDECFAVICDGKRRPLERPKRKKLIHLSPTATVAAENTYKTNREVKRLLAEFSAQSSNAS